MTDNKIYSNTVNSVDPALSPAKQCSPTALQAMGNRLLDWFSVVMADSSKRRRPRSKSKGIHFEFLMMENRPIALLHPRTNPSVVLLKSRSHVSFISAHFPAACKGEVRWMFQHLDVNADSKLSLEELYDLEHDQSEICLKPFLQQCDVDRDVIVTPSEWCRCFQRTERPCAAVKRKITPDLLGIHDRGKLLSD